MKPQQDITLMLMSLALGMTGLMLFNIWTYSHLSNLEAAQKATVKACEASIAGQAP